MGVTELVGVKTGVFTTGVVEPRGAMGDFHSFVQPAVKTNPNKTSVQVIGVVFITTSYKIE